MLRKRGVCIKNNDWEGLKKMDVKIQDEKNKSFQDLMTPVSVFITFESEEGYNRALAIKNQNMSINWNGQRVAFDPAPEPTDIIWENRQFTTF